MTFRNSSKFKIRAADEERLGDSLLTDQVEDRRFEKLNQRVTIITILIPILIGVIIFLGYLNIKEMVSQTQDMGAKELTSLAQSLESNISNITIKQAMLEETLAGKIAELDKMEASVQGSIKKMEATIQGSIKKTESSLAEMQAGKADKKDIAEAVSGMDNKLAVLQIDLKASLEKLHADIKSIEKKMTDEFAKSFETVNKVTTSVAECQADIGLLSAEKADKKATEVVLKNQEKRLQDQTNQQFRTLEGKMESLNAGIRELEKNKSAMEKTPPSPALRKPQAGSPSSNPGGSRGSGKPESGTFHEESIQE
jgi:septal ring factor EnvC (AmiA/AmiB activator)